MSDKDINSIDDELFDVSEPEVPEVADDADESTTDKVETQTYEFTSPNAEMSTPTFRPVSEKDRRSKYHIPLAATNYTPKEQSDIVKRPNYTDEDLDILLQNHFKNKIIKGFKLEGFVLQIRGTFDKC